jgi:hypothetical protein
MKRKAIATKQKRIPAGVDKLRISNNFTLIPNIICVLPTHIFCSRPIPAREAIGKQEHDDQHGETRCRANHQKDFEWQI